MRATVAAVGLACALALSATAFAGDPTAGFPAGWTHLQINVVGPNGRAHTEIFDRGRVQSVTPSSLTLRENDGSVVMIQVAPNALVRVDGRLGSLSQIGVGFFVRTLGIDGLPARAVAATTRVRVIPPRIVRPRPAAATKTGR
jgi:hypothetical protein